MTRIRSVITALLVGLPAMISATNALAETCLQRPVSCARTSPFGWRMDPLKKEVPRFHAGTDYGCAQGTPVQSSMSASVGGYGFIGDSASMTLHGVLFRGSPAPGYIKAMPEDASADSLHDHFPNEKTVQGAFALKSLNALSMPLISGVPGVKPIAASLSDRRFYFTGSKMVSPSQAVILACSEAVSDSAPFKQSRLNTLSETSGSGVMTPEPIVSRPKFK